MRRFLVAAAFSLLGIAALAQTDSTPSRTTISVPGSVPRSNDHFLLQFGYTQWQGAPDSIRTGGFPRTFNAYLMLDFPFKTNPHWSVALGAGIATDAIFFDKGSVNIAGTTPNLVFRNLADTNHFKRYKLATAYAEAPLELRFTAKPDDNRRSVKAVLGVKVGTLLNAHTKGSNLQNRNGSTINDFKQKDFGKRYFNKLRLSATARLGIGHFSLFTSYQLTPLFREGLAPTIRPVTVGLTISGL
jgi:hypothetical protein